MERRKFVEQMENKFRTPQDHRAIQLGPTAPSECNRAHIHVPERYQNPPQNTPQQLQQQQLSSTFEGLGTRITSDDSSILYLNFFTWWNCF